MVMVGWLIGRGRTGPQTIHYWLDNACFPTFFGHLSVPYGAFYMLYILYQLFNIVYAYMPTITILACTLLYIQIGDLKLARTKIDSFRSVITNPSRSEPNNFSFNSLLSFRSLI